MLLLLVNSLICESTTKPNIIFILADDMGFNDVSFHGSSQIFTPNIDSLAYSGIILNRYYVNPICTPSRSALMTGKYPIHTGMQHAVLYGAEPRGLPLSEKLLPQYLKELGYSNHIVGKWHLGHYTRAYTPLMRGFDSHIGPWTGHHDYFDHTAEEKGMTGLDMRKGFNIAYDLHGKYTTDVIKDEAVKIIQKRNASQPLFLYVAHTAVHSSNSYSPLPAPDDTVAKIKNIDNYNRRKYAAMMYHLDESVGAIVDALSQAKMLSNSIIIFSTDNGGPAEGFNLNAASNYPLRGVKNTLWEGGVRGAGLIWSPLLRDSERVSHQSFHISDWLPTLYAAAGGDEQNLKDLDGMNLWDELSKTLPSKRVEILHNIDPIWGSAALTVNQWKLMVGTNYNGNWDSWYGPAGDRNSSSYIINNLQTCKTAKALSSLGMFPPNAKISRLRAKATVTCGSKNPKSKCKPLEAPCLFDIIEDPCEQNNVAFQYPQIVETLANRLLEFNRSSLPPGNLPLDPRGNPMYYDRVWTNFGDFL
ncbi:unnamed protein product [Diamesa serratosioi]